MEGTVRVFNTREEFKKCDKSRALQDAAKIMWSAIHDGQVLHQPERLTPFVVITFADLKKNVFIYWFGFPVVMPRTPFLRGADGEFFGAEDCERIRRDARQLAGSRKTLPLAFLIRVRRNAEGRSYEGVEPLLQLLKNKSLSPETVVIGVIDPAATASPGWPVRNVLIFLQARPDLWPTPSVTVLCLRAGVRSVCLSVGLGRGEPVLRASDSLRAVGWERNSRGKLAPRKVKDIRAGVSAETLARDAAALNLQLMKWRMLPALKLDVLGTTKCLLVGAGTLGCVVARTLLGWGVKDISFVDCGRVSYSNPVRQSLFEFSDCTGDGKPKAEAAAAALKRIYPGVRAVGHNLEIPMPGHPFVEAKALATLVQRLHELVAGHDVVFLLTDTRESRWLPTVMAAAQGKLILNAALGFDTYLVMRHGVVGQAPHRLGCYFCNDVVAPTNSTTNRTLDQQCTVSRPSLANIAGSLAVELMVALVHHPLKALAPADKATPLTERHPSSPLGLLPHQIRGFLSHYQQMLPAVPAFAQCSACSETIVGLYKADKFTLVQKTLADPTYLERASGLSRLQETVCDVDFPEWSSEEGSDTGAGDM